MLIVFSGHIFPSVFSDDASTHRAVPGGVRRRCRSKAVVGGYTCEGNYSHRPKEYLPSDKQFSPGSLWSAPRTDVARKVPDPKINGYRRSGN